MLWGLTMRTIIAVAPNGGRRTKADHPALPMTADEIAREAAACREAGAAMLHLHVRDADGRHSLDAGLYREAIAGVRGAVGDGVVIQITTESVGLYEPAEQMAVVRAVRPHAVSLALRELAPREEDRAPFAAFLAWLNTEHIAPQVILYDRSDVKRLTEWAKAGDFDPRQVSTLYVLGRYRPPTAGAPADLLAIGQQSDLAFRDWMVCSFGVREIDCVVFASLLGGHIRVGFENNLALPDGSLADSNAAIVRATTDALQALGHTPATAAELRELWRIG